MSKMPVSNIRIVTADRRLTLPEGIGLHPHDVIEFTPKEDGTVIIQKLVKEVK